MSGPLRDRIDLSVEVPPVPIDAALERDVASETSAVVAARVVGRAGRGSWRATPRPWASGRTARRRRPGSGHPRTWPADARRVLEQAAIRQSWSARVFDRVLKVARTIADLDGHDRIEEAHVAEAVQFRMGDLRPQG